ncbi:hypothetical protein Hanom_Chr07g00665491 [Helianthus anomalus]
MFKVGRQGWRTWRTRMRLRIFPCWKAVMLRRIRAEKLVVMEQQRCKLHDWAMMDISD